MQYKHFSWIKCFILENRLYCFFIDEKLKNISTYFLYKEFFSRINAILMFSPIDTRIIDENVDTAYRNSINNSQLLMKMSILRIEICINNLCIDGIKHQYCVILRHFIFRILYLDFYFRNFVSSLNFSGFNIITFHSDHWKVQTILSRNLRTYSHIKYTI